jgi:hypothetical protein
LSHCTPFKNTHTRTHTYTQYIKTQYIKTCSLAFCCFLCMLNYTHIRILGTHASKHTHTQTHTHAHKQGVIARTTTLPLAHKNTCRQCAAYMLIWQLQGLFWQRQGLVYALLATSRSRICPFGNIKVCHEEQLLLSHYESVPPSSGVAHRAELLDKVLVKE